MIGQLDTYYSKLFRTLLACETLILQPYMISSSHRTLCSKTTKMRGKSLPPVVTLSVVFYGPMCIFENVGDFLSKSSQYLQSPLHCDRNVPYKNPQSLSRIDKSPPNTFELSFLGLDSQVETLSQAHDPAASLETKHVYSETEAANLIRTSLYR